MRSVYPDIEEPILELPAKSAGYVENIAGHHQERGSRVAVHSEDAPLSRDAGRYRGRFDEVNAFRHREGVVERGAARGHAGCDVDCLDLVAS